MRNRLFIRSGGIRRILCTAAAATLGLGLLVNGPAIGDQLPVDLLDLGTAGFRFDGAAASDQSGWSVAGAGDVNADGYDDMLIGAALADTANGANSGAAYVIFGNTDVNSLDLSNLGTAGFRIDGAAAEDRSGYSVAGAGDVNNDGYDDILIGARGADNNSRVESGSSYVVFGSVTPTTVNLASLGSAGFRIDGAAADDRSGTSVSGAGDVNKDGYDEILIGASGADNNSRFNSGSSYLVFGSATPTTVDLASLGSAGFRIDGATSPDNSGWSVAGAGDVDDDGVPDLLVGAPFHGSAGSAYVIFGKSDTGTIDLNSLGTAGFLMDGGKSGEAVAGAGDVNNDGLADLLIGARTANNNNRAASGSTYVVFGKSDSGTIDLNNLGTAGFRIDGAASDNQSGYAVDGAGDIDDDGYPDLLIGAPSASNNGRIGSGSSYVVYGKATSTNVDLATLGTAGFRIDGAAAVDKSGSAVAGLGDVNGDGDADVLIGAPETDNNNRSTSGSSYLIVEAPPVYTTPGAPTGVTGTPADQQVQLSWTAPASDGGAAISGYQIETSTAGGPWTVSTANTGTPTTSATLTGLTNGTAYQFRVSAINPAGTGPTSDPSATTTPRTTPGAPTGVTGTPADQQVQLSWTAPASDGGAAISGYQIETSTAGGPWTTAIANTGTPTTSATLTGLTNGTAYQFRVSAINPAGTGPTSDPSATTTPRTTPGAPTGVTGTPADQQVQLSWTAPASDGGAAISGYQIETSTAGGPWTVSTANTGTPTTSATLTGLTNGTAYQFRVSAINPAGTGPTSDPSGELVPAAVSPPPITPPPITPPPITPPPITPPAVTPPASLAVTARAAKKAVPRKGKVALVKKVTVGPGQKAKITVKVKPKKTKKRVKVIKTSTTVKVRTKKAPKGKVTVTITATGTGYTPASWTRTWKVR